MARIQPRSGCCVNSRSSKDSFISERDLKTDTNFHGRKSTVIPRLKKQVSGHYRLRCESLTDEHQLYCLEFAGSNVDRH
jgi:hypothetical protein